MPSSRLQGDKVDQLRQGQRDHREIDPVAADRDHAERQPQKRCRSGARQHGKLERKAPHLGGVGCDVGGTAKERRVTEGQQAGRPHRELKGAGKQGETDHLDEEERIEQMRSGQDDEDPGYCQREPCSPVLHAISPTRTSRSA
jgi:hypothetical protein